MNRLARDIGIAGYSLSNYRNALVVRHSGGAALLEPGVFWFCEHHELPPGGAIWWDHHTAPGGVLGDRVGIYYVAQPQGGAFRLSVSIDGGPWENRLTLDGHSPTPVGLYAELSLDSNRHRIRLDGDSGRNVIIGPQVVDSRSGGLHAVFMNWPGIHLGQVVGVSPAIRDAVVGALKPDLIVWHMKEDVPGQIAERMRENESWWRRAAPESDVLYIGTPWIESDSTLELTRKQNSIVREIALENNRAYIDLMQPTQSYGWLLEQGFMADSVHLNSDGGSFTADVLWDAAGFFALGKHRSLSLRKVGDDIRIEYPMSENLVYRLEQSTNLRDWAPIVTNGLGSANYSTEAPVPDGAIYFRLGITPINE